MRIVSLAPSHTEIIYALEAQDHLVGVTDFCDHPPHAKETKEVVGGFIPIKWDAIDALAPDLVLTSTFLQEKAVKKLRHRGHRVVHVDPRTLDGVLDSFLAVGDALGRRKEAHLLVEETSARLRACEEQAQDFPWQKVYVEEWHKPPMIAGNWVPHLLETAGGVSLLPPGQPSQEIDIAELKEWNPALILSSICGHGQEKAHEGVEAIRSREAWQQLPAVQMGRVYGIDDSLLNRPGPRLVDGCELVQALIKQHV